MPRRVLEGRVVSDKCDKTVTVLVERRVREPLYGKIIRRSEKYAAHDENNAFSIGDVVQIEECRPLSKSKRWRIITTAEAGKTRVRTTEAAGEQAVAPASEKKATKSAAGKTAAQKSASAAGKKAATAGKKTAGKKGAGK